MDDETQITLGLPFTVQFEIRRSTMATLNDATFLVYNLAETTRDKIFQDWFNTNSYRRVTFEAGYGDQLFSCFAGSLYYAKSYRQGADIITEINARDGGFDTANTLTHKTLASGAKMSDIAKTLAADFPHLDVGAIGNFDTMVKRPTALSGNTFQQMLKYFEKDVFIDNEKVNVLLSNEVKDTGEVPIFSPETGLLETPSREDAALSVKTLFYPQVEMGQAVELRASVMKNYNGQHKVIGVTHAGTISAAVNGECYSKFDLLVGSTLFGNYNVVKESANVRP